MLHMGLMITQKKIFMVNTQNKIRNINIILKVKVLVIQSCLTLCDPMNCSLSGSSVLGIIQARIMEWVAIFFSRGSSQPKDQTPVSCTAGIVSAI